MRSKLIFCGLIGILLVLSISLTHAEKKESSFIEKQSINYQVGILGCFNILGSVLGLITAGWDLAKAILRHAVSYQIKTELLEKGFDYFEATGVSQQTAGVPDADLLEFTNLLGNAIQLPSEQQNELNIVLQESVMTGSSLTWTAHQILYNQNNVASNQANYAIVLLNHNTTTNTSNWLYSYFTGSFTLAPNILVIQKTDSRTGGLFVVNSLIYKDLPQGITESDAEGIFDFFQYVGIKSLCNILNITATFPPITQASME